MHRIIKLLYKEILVHNKALVCEKLNWAHPVSYKLTVCDKSILSAPFTNTIINPATMDFASVIEKSYILNSEKIYECNNNY